MPKYKVIGWIVLIGLALIVICYFFVDKTAAEFALDHSLRKMKWLNWLTYFSPLIYAASFFSIIITAVRRCINSKVTQPEQAIFVGSINTVITVQLCKLLKYTFGRTWPTTWIHNNPSWLINHVYGFHFFHGGKGYASFPSGHMTVVVSMITVLWICFPKLRWLFALIAVATAVGLLGFYYHFVSDVLAGALLGIITGSFAVRGFVVFSRNNGRHTG